MALDQCKKLRGKKWEFLHEDRYLLEESDSFFLNANMTTIQFWRDNVRLAQSTAMSQLKKMTGDIRYFMRESTKKKKERC